MRYFCILLGFIVVAVLGGFADAGLFGPFASPGAVNLSYPPRPPSVPVAGTSATISAFPPASSASTKAETFSLRLPTPTSTSVAAEYLSLSLLTPTPAPAGIADHELTQLSTGSVAGTAAGPVANADANLRAGPGTTYDCTGSVVAGAPLAIVARTAAGNWYQLESGVWIAAFLVDGAPKDVPVVVEMPMVK